MTVNAKSFITAAIAVTCIGAASADQQAVNLVLDAPSAGVNRFTIDIEAISFPDSDTTDFSGNAGLLLDLTFDPLSHVASVSGLEFTGGNLSGTDVGFSLAGGVVTITMTDLGGTMNTPSPFGSVVGGSFDASEHELIINQGTVLSSGQEIDLSASPVVGATTGNGTIVVTLDSVIGNIATYNVALNLPVDFSDTFTVDLSGTPIDVDVDVSGGSVVANGSFTRVVPEPALAGPLALAGILLRRRRRA